MSNKKHVNVNNPNAAYRNNQQYQQNRPRLEYNKPVENQVEETEVEDIEEDETLEQEELVEEVIETSTEEVEEVEVAEEPVIETVVEESEPIKSDIPKGIVEVTHPIPGKSVILNNTPVYRKSDDTKPFIVVKHNKFYFYDNMVVNGRAKITQYRNDRNPNNPSLIFGYINI